MAHGARLGHDAGEAYVGLPRQPETGDVLEEPWGTRDTGPLAVADGSLWIGDFLDGSVARIDPSSGETIATTPVSERTASWQRAP